MKDFLKSVPWYVWLGLSIVVGWLVWVYLIPFIEGLATSASYTSQQLATGETPTLTSTQAQGIADSIYNSGNVFWSNDNSGIEADFQQMKNDADFNLVGSKFGTRTWGALGLIGAGSGNMQAFIRAFFDADEITKLNGILTNNGVKSQI